MGRDIFVRTMYGARISLTIGFTAAAINMVIGVFYGGIAGYLGRRTDMIMMRIVDVLSGIPSLLYLILIMMFLGNTVKVFCSPCALPSGLPRPAWSADRF